MHHLSKLLLSLLLGSFLFNSLPAQAYDIDTHFYHTYIMARYAGLNHDVALFLATSDQWADENSLTSPLQPPLTPVQGLEFLRKQRFIHFACPLRRDGTVGFSLESIKQNGVMSSLTDLTCEVDGAGNGPFASELLMKGMRTGDLLIAAAGLHTLQDSYAHAGYPNHWGHAPHGHWPDRPFARPEFYQRMIRTFFKALVAIRTLLPAEALDFRNQNFRMDADQLADEYLARPDVQVVIHYNPLRDDALYANTVFQQIITSGIKGGYLTENSKTPSLRQNLLEEAKSKLGPADALPTKMMEVWIQRALHIQNKPGSTVFINMDAVLRDILGGRPIVGGHIPQDVIDAEGGIGAIISKAVVFFTANHVPRPPTNVVDEPFGTFQYHPSELESEGQASARDLEMRLRVAAYKNLTQRLYGIQLDFNEKNFLQRMSKAYQKHWDDFFSELIKKGTYSLILSFAGDLTYINRAIESPEFQTLQKYIPGPDIKPSHVNSEETRFQASPNVMGYQYPNYFEDMIQSGEVRALATTEEIKGISAQNSLAGYSERSLLIQVEKP